MRYIYKSLPQDLHNIASFLIVSAQYGHFLLSSTEPAPADSTPNTCGSSFTSPGFEYLSTTIFERYQSL